MTSTFVEVTNPLVARVGRGQCQQTCAIFRWVECAEMSRPIAFYWELECTCICTLSMR
jgi:hypothetical protein